MSLEVGKINNLEVERKTDIGYILTDDDYNEVFIHNNQVKTPINEGDYIDVFLYFDHKKRLSATMEKPFIEIDKPGFVKVKDINPKLGIFIDNNTVKDPLISYDDLPQDSEVHPEIGDTVFVKLKNTKTQLIAKLVSPGELKDQIKPKEKLKTKDKVTAYVIKSGKEGINLLSKEKHLIFIYYKHLRRKYRIGEEITVTITNIKEDQTYNGTLLDSLLETMASDKDIILNYLKENDDFMEFTSKSDVKDIEKTFKMSKSAFKRALGNLYKEQKIEIKEDGTYLIK